MRSPARSTVRAAVGRLERFAGGPKVYTFSSDWSTPYRAVKRAGVVKVK